MVIAIVHLEQDITGHRLLLSNTRPNVSLLPICASLIKRLWSIYYGP